MWSFSTANSFFFYPEISKILLIKVLYTPSESSIKTDFPGYQTEIFFPFLTNSKNLDLDLSYKTDLESVL